MGMALSNNSVKFRGVILFTFTVTAKELSAGRSEFLDIWSLVEHHGPKKVAANLILGYVIELNNCHDLPKFKLV